MTGQTQPTPRRKRIPDAQILEAATREFVTAGFQDARIAQIAEDARVTKRTLYVRFDSKGSLFRAALDFEARELTRRLMAAYAEAPTESTLRERLHEYVQAYFAYAADRPDGFRLLFLDEQANAEIGLQQPITERIAELVAIAAGGSEPNQQHELLAALIVAVTHNGAGSAVTNGMPLAEAAVITERFLGHALGGLLRDARVAQQKIRETS